MLLDERNSLMFTKNAFGRFCFIAACALSHVIFAEGTYYLLSNEGKADLSSYGIYDPKLWDPSSSSFDANGVYVVKSTSGKRLTVTTTAKSKEFNGGVLQLGDGGQHGYLEIMTAWPDVIKANNRGLRINHGAIYCRSSGLKTATDGILTLASDGAKNKMSVLWGYNKSVHRHKGAMASESPHPFHVGGTNALVASWTKGNRLELLGDCTACTNRIIVMTEGSKTEKNPEVTLAIGQTDIPGNIELCRNGSFATVKGSKIKIKSLAYDSDGWFECSCALDRLSLGMVSVTGEFSVAKGPVKVILPKETPLNDGVYPVLEVPAESEVSPDDFVLAESLYAEYCRLELVEDVAKKTLNIVYSGVPNTAAYAWQMGNEAVIDSTESWSDGTASMQPGKHYVLDPDRLEADVLRMSLTLPTEKKEYVFRGESISLYEGCSLVVKEDDTVIKDSVLNMGNSSIMTGTKVDYTLKDCTIKLNGEVHFCATSDRSIIFDSAIAGCGSLCFSSVMSGSSEPYGRLYLRKKNSSFFGTVDTTLHQTKYATFDTKYQRLYLSYPESLGGDLRKLNRSALVLNHYVRLIPNSSMEIARKSNRGIMVRNGAVISVSAVDRVFALSVPVSLHGELRKDGDGVLVLKGTAAGFGEDGTSSEPVEGKNIFAVKAGVLRIGSVDAVNGMSVTFANGARLELQPDLDDPELLRYGIRNVKCELPFALEAGGGVLPFSVLKPSAEPERGKAFRMALLTVPDNESAVSIARLAVKDAMCPMKGFKGTLVEDRAEQNSVTFAVDYTPVGFCISLR